MQEKEFLVKTMKKSFKDKIQAGIIWFSFIAVINRIKLAPRELQLLSFINYRGTISSTSAKEEFCKLFDSSEATISNIISKKLMPKKLVVKDKSKIKINPSLVVDFTKTLVVNLTLDVQEPIKEEDKDAV